MFYRPLFMGFTTVKADTFGSLVISCPIENVSVSLYRVADTEMNLVSPFLSILFL